MFSSAHLYDSGNYSLRINLEDFDGNQRYADYKYFKVENEKVIIFGQEYSQPGFPLQMLKGK